MNRPDDKRRSIGLRIGILARIMRNNFDRKVAVHNVTRSKWTMIAVVSGQPGSTQRYIAETLEMSEASAGRLVDRLCAEGLLERREREDDRRARAVYLTEAAKPLLETLAAIAEASEDRIFKDFSEDDLNQLEGYIDRIYDNVSRD